jgi:hypothetical protein
VTPAEIFWLIVAITQEGQAIPYRANIFDCRLSALRGWRVYPKMPLSRPFF